jgi:hypothetical protein
MYSPKAYLFLTVMTVAACVVWIYLEKRSGERWRTDVDRVNRLLIQLAATEDGHFVPGDLLYRAGGPAGGKRAYGVAHFSRGIFQLEASFSYSEMGSTLLLKKPNGRHWKLRKLARWSTPRPIVVDFSAEFLRRFSVDDPLAVPTETRETLVWIARHTSELTLYDDRIYVMVARLTGRLTMDTSLDIALTRAVADRLAQVGRELLVAE